MRESSSLKVLFVATKLGQGGAERSLAEWLPVVEDRGVQCIVACMRRCPDGVEPEVLDQGFDVRFLPDPRLRSRVTTLRRLIDSERPDLIHTALRNTSFSTGLAALGTGVPVLQSLVNRHYAPEVGRPPEVSAARHWGRRWRDAWVARRLSTHIHAVSEAVRSYAIGHLHIPPERITVVARARDARRLGVPSESRRQLVRARLGLETDDQVLVNVANHKRGKAHEDLLEAVALLRPKYPRIRLVMAGRPGETTSLIEETIDRLGLLDVVTSLGYRQDVPDILAAADLFVFPSFAEGLPGVLIEASALGLPIAASNTRPIREVVETGGSALLFTPHNPEAMATVVGELLANASQRDRFGRRSRQIYEERFELEPSVDRMLDLFSRVVAMGRSRAEIGPGGSARTGMPPSSDRHRLPT